MRIPRTDTNTFEKEKNSSAGSRQRNILIRTFHRTGRFISLFRTVFEAGAIGQRLYLASETLGLRATGIGAFFDEEVNRYLSLSPEVGQVAYHFAIGYPIPDPCLKA